jgi:hypothetical protein
VLCQSSRGKSTLTEGSIFQGEAKRECLTLCG